MKSGMQILRFLKGKISEGQNTEQKIQREEEVKCDQVVLSLSWNQARI